MAATHPPKPCLVHRLPAAPHFVGRDAELHALRRFWQDGFQGVFALVGLGGAGKTAVAARFLDELLGPDGRPRPEGCFGWSFYQEPDPGLFLREACHYFGREDDPAATARGAGLLHLLRDRLALGGPHLLVLDGLERVQCPEGGGHGFGAIEDSLLRGLLVRVAAGVGRVVVLVTSRFPLTDLDGRRGRGYLHQDVGGLGRPAALALLRARGVWGEDAELERLIDAYGAHALTLDHLGGLIGQFLGGDPSRAPEAPVLGPAGDRQGVRLARLLRAYENHLPAPELALLCRLCLLRRSATAEQIEQLFLCAPAIQARTVRELAAAVVRLPEAASHREVVRGLAATIQQALEEALAQAPLAGPDTAFRREVLRAAASVFEVQDPDSDADMVEVARLYAGQPLDHATDRLPLSASDRRSLNELCARFAEVCSHPLLPFHKPDPTLETAFQTAGFKKHRRQWTIGDPNPLDLLRGLKLIRERLRYLTGKHFALQRVRQLCAVYQRKWSLAGPLAPLSAPELRDAINALVGRHLVLRESDGSFSVHPAVRDHFARLAASGEQGAWHDVLREQLVSLVERPGKRLPDDPRSLDLVEEAIYHAVQAGQPAEAVALYRDLLGGLRHLGWRLGEMARGLRVLRGFDPCPEPWDLAWYLRALGELEEAYRHNHLAYFRADIRLLQGRLPEVAAEGDSTRTAAAAFLMGETMLLPPDQLAGAVPLQQLLLYQGRLDRVGRSSMLAGFYANIGWEGDCARLELFLAECARRRGHGEKCNKYLEAAAGWTLHAGSVEHLCLWHLVRARAARAAGDGEAAQRAVGEGLHLAGQCGLGLYHVELLCAQAELCLDRADPTAAAHAASLALERASADGCRFAWGMAAAGALVGRALVNQGRPREARTILERTFVLGCRLQDPGAEAVARLLEDLPA